MLDQTRQLAGRRFSHERKFMSSRRSITAASRPLPGFPAIPLELRERTQWVCWRRKPGPEGKIKKIPVDPKNGKNGSHSDPATWGTYEQALAQFTKGTVTGIGFVFTENDPYVGIDLDASVRDGVPTDLARSIVHTLDSYTETSPSGSGLHIIVRAPGFSPEWNKRAGFEVYATQRFFTMTGDVIETRNFIEDRPVELTEWTQSVSLDPETAMATSRKPKKGSSSSGMKSERVPRPAVLRTPPDEDDLELIERLRDNPRFFRLYDHGDTSEHGYDASRADLSMLTLVAHELIRSGLPPEPERLDRILRSSALVRPKWLDRADYRRMTIEKAVDFGNELANGPALPNTIEELQLEVLGLRQLLAGFGHVMSVLPRILRNCQPRCTARTAHALAIEFLARESRNVPAPYAISKSRLADSTGLSRNTIASHIKKLEQSGLLVQSFGRVPGDSWKTTLLEPVGSAEEFLRAVSTP